MTEKERGVTREYPNSWVVGCGLYLLNVSQGLEAATTGLRLLHVCHSLFHLAWGVFSHGGTAFVGVSHVLSTANIF